MPPKQKSVLDKIRADQAKLRAALAVVKGSAYSRLEEQNAKLRRTAVHSRPVANSSPRPRNVVSKPEVATKVGTKPSANEVVSKPVVELPTKVGTKPSANEVVSKPVVELPTKVSTKPSANKVVSKSEVEPASKVATKPSAYKVVKPPSRKPSVIQRKASIAKKIVTSKKYLDSDDEDSVTESQTESWVPAGGHLPSSTTATGTATNTASKSVGIARIPGWRVEKFTKQLGEFLLMEVVTDDDLFKVRVKTEDEGLEELTDVYVQFETAERAEELRGKIDGKMLDGRMLKVGSGKN
ncbi:uncharacterized protein SEPMUDRAFT_110410 [Sphaerulina musiva SO2202]|uniref:RRM domain-containing protein n=1 Tax=Sphaerulina musiva (strain SO2202) TaxID=692275 RepID=M3CCA4_SPHMS|nr:uncharacterized protein SEPMUDRAFT_110410 [Sphaerulina musiva SO2202]EMF10007.1 hypothetical protein SEPMUDRAFT_110410 [Sphaerulina musiva SO2202]